MWSSSVDSITAVHGEYTLKTICRRLGGGEADILNHCVMLSSVQQGSVTQLVSNQISFVLLLYPEPFTRVRWLRVFLPVGHGWGGGGPYQSWLLGRAPLIYGALQLEITPRGLWDSKMQIVLLESAPSHPDLLDLGAVNDTRTERCTTHCCSAMHNCVSYRLSSCCCSAYYTSETNGAFKSSQGAIRPWFPPFWMCTMTKLQQDPSRGAQSWEQQTERNSSKGAETDAADSSYQRSS